MVGEENQTNRFSRLEVDNWWRNILGSPKHIVAPMVDASELPWRLLSRRYKAQLCFTPMIHSRNFVQDIKYRKEHLAPCTCPEDRPLIVQFCGNDASILAEAATIVKDHCDGVDINLGCPQAIAKRGHYGAFLQNEWDLLALIIRKITEVGIPVSCKIRIFPEIEKTVRYAKMLETAGCWMLTVHGRTIAQKGPVTGLASWSHIKAVKEAVRVPVVANGNIQYMSDVIKCMEETLVDGVMSAEGNLHNPALFSGLQPPVWEVAIQYLNLVNKYPCPLSYTRGHLFKLFYHILILEENIDLRDALAKADGIPAFETVTTKLKERYEKRDIEGWLEEMSSPGLEVGPSRQGLQFPPWICQPYERPPPISSPLHRPRQVDNLNIEFKLRDDGDGIISGESRNRLKRMKRNPHKNWDAERVPMILCSNCPNPVGPKCDCCKKCCRDRCYRETIDCESHKTFPKTNPNLNSISNTPTDIAVQAEL